MRDLFNADLKITDAPGNFDYFLTPGFRLARRCKGLQFLAQPGERVSLSIFAGGRSVRAG
jgi:hypothetical protein